MGDSELKFRTVHFDSRLRSSGTNSNFTYQLSESFTTPENTICYIDSVSVPHSWNTISADNNTLYLAEKVGSVHTIRAVTLPIGDYKANTLRTALETALNAGTLPTGVLANYTCMHIIITNKIIISSPDHNTVSFHLLTDDEIKVFADPSLLNINVRSPNSGNGILRNRNGGYSTVASGYDYVTSWSSGFVDILNHHNVYICSSLASYATMGPIGQPVLAKVPVSSSWGVTIHYAAPNVQIYSDIGKRTISEVSFSLQDAFGRIIDLEGGTWSLSLTFMVKD
jgi:hypothetical protein